MSLNYKLRKEYTTVPENAIDEILIDRGIAAENLELFKFPKKEQCELSPFLLDNIKEGAELVTRHIQNNDTICLVVDADCDGFCSSAIFWLYFQEIFNYNLKIDYVVQDGKRHGLEHLMSFFTEEQHYDLIVCPDSSSNDLSYIQQLNEVGSDVLVIDHHLCEYEGYDSLPSNMILINNQQSANYSNKELCGAGVVYKFCQAYDILYNYHSSEHFMDLTALGNIADVMNKTSIETNCIIEHGLRMIMNPLLIKLLEKQKHPLQDKAVAPFVGLTSIDISFYIAPLINAIVRMGTVDENSVMFKAFLNPFLIVPSTKLGAKGTNEFVYEQLLRNIDTAKRHQKKIKDDAIVILSQRIEENNLQNNAIIVLEVSEEDNIPPSMRGLIASNLVSMYNRPVLIGARNIQNELCGSLRGNDNFAALPNLKDFLESTGMFKELHGHQNAGAYVIDADKLEDFIAFCNTTFSPDDFSNCYLVDYVLDASYNQLYDLCFEIATNMKYFGNGIDEIKLIIKDIPLNNRFVMGENKNHEKITINGLELVRFSDESFVELSKKKNMVVDAIGHLKINSYDGKAQFLIDDYDFHNDSSYGF